MTDEKKVLVTLDAATGSIEFITCMTDSECRDYVQRDPLRFAEDPFRSYGIIPMEVITPALIAAGENSPQAVSKRKKLWGLFICTAGEWFLESSHEQIADCIAAAARAEARNCRIRVRRVKV